MAEPLYEIPDRKQYCLENKKVDCSALLVYQKLLSVAKEADQKATLANLHARIANMEAESANFRAETASAEAHKAAIDLYGPLYENREDASVPYTENSQEAEKDFTTLCGLTGLRLCTTSDRDENILCFLDQEINPIQAHPAAYRQSGRVSPARMRISHPISQEE